MAYQNKSTKAGKYLCI